MRAVLPKTTDDFEGFYMASAPARKRKGQMPPVPYKKN